MHNIEIPDGLGNRVQIFIPPTTAQVAEIGLSTIKPPATVDGTIRVKAKDSCRPEILM